jgi:hypothetical protein
MKILEKIGVLGIAKIQALMGFVFGLIYGILVFLTEIYSIPLDTTTQATTSYGPIIMIIAPIAFAIYGFVLGVCIALLYNLFARFFGGIKIELKEYEHGKKN